MLGSSWQWSVGATMRYSAKDGKRVATCGYSFGFGLARLGAP